MEQEKINVILATDCGSTTSKARFFKKVKDEYRFIAAGEAPTTVEAPYENVTLGVRNAIREVEELTGHKILSSNGIIMPSKGNIGVDLYVTTSSAGGGLQMLVAGLVKTMTAESAERAALGAGAIVMDVLAVDDGRMDWERIEKVRFLRPDMILISGGTDGGNVIDVVKMAELIKAADPKARFGEKYTLPIVYAGNMNTRDEIKKLFTSDKYTLIITDNIRPVLEVENILPARNAIHQSFMEHVMSHAPGYDQLMKWTNVPIMPTPAAEGMMFKTFADAHNCNLIGVGLGGATTNVYSIFEGKFVRTVSANLGMSYSICNVLRTVGMNNILRWIPFEITEEEVANTLYNKMIRPTTIPQTLEHLAIEHAVAREAIRKGFEHHKSLARPLIGALRERGFETAFYGVDRTQSYIDLNKVNWIGGTGGLLSHAPRRVQSALILIDAFQTEGVTQLFQDSIFMIPHLGVLSTVHKKAALEIFEKDCIVRLGTCIALSGTLKEEDYDEVIADIKINMSNGDSINTTLNYYTIKKFSLKENEKAIVEIRTKRGLRVAGKSHLKTEVSGGVVGLIIDCRGRPLKLPIDEKERRKKLLEWFTSLEVYPTKALDKWK